MDSSKPSTESGNATGWRQHSFLVMVGGAIVIACVLVFVSMELYSSSGAAQLDLSLPSYNNVRSSIPPDTTSAYPSTGAFDKNSLNQFRTMYTAEAQQTAGAEGFNSQALSDQALGIGSSGSDQTAGGAQ
jgi:hypothetical protein